MRYDIVSLSARDLADLCVVIEASVACDPVLRDLSDGETYALHARLLGRIARGTFDGVLLLDESDLHAVAGITMALDVQGVEYFPSLRDAEITDRRLDDLCDLVWPLVRPARDAITDHTVLSVQDSRSHIRDAMRAREGGVDMSSVIENEPDERGQDTTQPSTSSFKSYVNSQDFIAGHSTTKREGDERRQAESSPESPESPPEQREK